MCKKGLKKEKKIPQKPSHWVAQRIARMSAPVTTGIKNENS